MFVTLAEDVEVNSFGLPEDGCYGAGVGDCTRRRDSKLTVSADMIAHRARRPGPSWRQWVGADRHASPGKAPGNMLRQFRQRCGPTGRAAAVANRSPLSLGNLIAGYSN